MLLIGISMGPLSSWDNGRVQQTQLLRIGSVSARCYWCILLDHPIAASAHGSAPQQLNLLNATNLSYPQDKVYCVGYNYSSNSDCSRLLSLSDPAGPLLF